MFFEIMMFMYMMKNEILLAENVYDYRNYFVGLLNIIFLAVYLIVFWILIRQLK